MILMKEMQTQRTEATVSTPTIRSTLQEDLKNSILILRGTSFFSLLSLFINVGSQIPKA
jgi:hypothetical protein